MLYTGLKHLHITCAALSLLGFVWRGLLMMRESPALRSRFWRVVPHVVDTVLLLSAIGLASMIGFGANAHWLGAKIAGLFVYIGLGTLALKRGRTKAVRVVCWLLALGVFGYIVSVAVTHNPLGFLA